MTPPRIANRESGLSRRTALPGIGAFLTASTTALSGGFASARADATTPRGALHDDPRGMVLGPGLYRVDHNLEVTGDIVLTPGATIDIAAGKTLRILGCFQAPVAPVFSGAGSVDLNRARVPAAFPEWWGAQPNEPDADCARAIMDCIAAHPVAILRAGDYHLHRTLIIARAHRRIWGSGSRGMTSGEGTRLIIGSGSTDAVRVGPAAAPGAVNDFIEGVDLRWMEIARSAAVDDAADHPPAGLRVSHVKFCHFEGVSSSEHGCGFVATGVVHSHFRDCSAFRSRVGSSEGGTWRGFWLDGTAHIGLAGGNASLYLGDCSARIGGNPKTADPVGLMLDGAFADTFVDRFETAGVATGIRVDGHAAAIGRRAAAGHVNLHLRMPIIDQCSLIGIDIRDTAPQAQIDISEPYVAVAPGAIAGVRCDGMRGALTLASGQLLGFVDAEAGGSAAGLSASDSCGLQISGLKVLEHRNPLLLDRCSNVSLQGWVGNQQVRAERSAALFRDCEGIAAALIVTGERGSFDQGVCLSGRTRRAHIDQTGVDPHVFADPAARIVIDGEAHRGSVVIEGV